MPPTLQGKLVTRRALSIFFFVLICLSVVNGTSAQETSRPFSKIVTEWNRTLDNARRYIGAPVHFEERNLEYRVSLNEVRTAAQAAAGNAANQIDQLERLLEALGPAPKDDEPPERPEIKIERAKYEEDIAFYRARVSQAEVAMARADALSAAISELSRAQLVQDLLTANPVPLLPETISQALPDIYRAARALARTPALWWDSLSEETRTSVLFLRIPAFLIVALLVGWGIRYLAVRFLGCDPDVAEPSYARRLVGAVADAVSRGIFPAMILAVILVRITSDGGVFTGSFAIVLAALCKALILFVLAWSLPRAALAPSFPQWRLTVLRPAGARTLSHRITVLAIFVSVNYFVVEALLALPVGRSLEPEAEALVGFCFHAINAAGMLAVLQPRLWRVDEVAARKRGEEDETPAAVRRGHFWTAIRILFAATAIVAVIASAAGYGQLGAYLIGSLIATGLIGGGLYLARGLLRETVAIVLRSALIARKVGLQHRTRRLAKFWLRALLDLVIVVGGAFLIAPGWGVPADELSLWAAQIFQGFKVGNVTISILDFALGIAIFIAIVLLTRAGQRGLSERILPETEIDAGLQHSLAAGFGYVGIVIAAMLGVAAVGLDLTNVALIAGALSVGIGFGLQNIVNNFVSGITLLIERPIKVGDWVVVGEQQGIVKRIQVRATEIETFQRTSVIVPNSAFLQEPVLNRTHKDSFGRIEVPVGVAYGSDTALVEQILLDAAKENPKIATWPEPFVLFQNFGNSSLDFELRCFCPNVFDTFRAGSELRFAIDRAFRREGIEIPFPQHDVHLKDIDRIERLLAPRRERNTD